MSHIAFEKARKNAPKRVKKGDQIEKQEQKLRVKENVLEK